MHKLANKTVNTPLIVESLEQAPQKSCKVQFFSWNFDLN
jgi:hypothetical protein